MQKICKIHGLTDFSTGKIPWCRKCNVEGVMRRHRELKSMATEYKGGKCIICGYNKHSGSLDFHHIDPKEKDTDVGTMINSRSWKSIKAELDKCVLVCRNCHGEIHGGIVTLPEKGTPG